MLGKRSLPQLVIPFTVFQKTKGRLACGAKQNRIPLISFVGVSTPALQELPVASKADVLPCLDEADLLVCGISG